MQDEDGRIVLKCPFPGIGPKGAYYVYADAARQVSSAWRIDAGFIAFVAEIPMAQRLGKIAGWRDTPKGTSTGLSFFPDDALEISGCSNFLTVVLS